MRSAGRLRAVMEGGGKDGPAFNQQRVLSPCCWLYLEIMLLILLLLPLQLLSESDMCHAQSFGFKVLDRCAGSTPKCDTGDDAFEVGCTVRVLCSMTCTNETLETERNLTVYFGGDTNQCIAQGPGCNVTMELQNITVGNEGLYTCADLNNSPKELCRNQFFSVGYCPVKPRSMTFMYKPKESIVVWVDPVKHDNTAKWRLSYSWRNKEVKKCPRQRPTRCTDLTPEGCKVCDFAWLRYIELGDYVEGNIGNPFKAIVSVTNKVGSVSIDESFVPCMWVNPGPVAKIEVKRANSSNLFLRIKGPAKLDQYHFKIISELSLTRLTFNYTVDLLPLWDQYNQEQESKDFFERHGFFRNLEDDQVAMTALVDITSNFPKMSSPIIWDSKKLLNKTKISSEKFVTPQLPFSGYWYNVSVQTKSRYWGGVTWIRGRTRDSVPTEGPQFEDSFAFCHTTAESCAECLIYFKEIPLPKRGGVIMNHTLTLTLLNGDAVLSNSACANDSKFEDTIGGQNNTFHLMHLPLGANYNMRLQAWNSQGLSSPPTFRLLSIHSTPSLLAPRDIMLEFVSGSQYYDIDISWKSGHADAAIKVNYFVSICYATGLQLYEHEASLNCVDNLKVNQSEPGISFYSTGQLHKRRGVTPALFVSASTADDQHSQLQPPHRFYAKGKGADKVGVFNIKPGKDPKAIEVIFPLPYGKDLDYKYGLPHRYAVKLKQVTESTCTQQCSHVMKSAKLVNTAVIENSLQESIMTQVDHVKTGVPQCVGVALFHLNEESNERKEWSCQSITLPVPDDSNGLTVWLSIGILSVLLITFVFFCCRRAYKLDKRFPKEAKVPMLSTHHSKEPLIDQIEGNENPRARQDVSITIEQSVSTSDSALPDDDSLTSSSVSGVGSAGCNDTSNYDRVTCKRYISEDTDEECSDADEDEDEDEDETDDTDIRYNSFPCSPVSSPSGMSSSTESTELSSASQMLQELPAADEIVSHEDSTGLLSAASTDKPLRESEGSGQEKEVLSLEDLLQATKMKNTPVDSSEVAVCENGEKVEDEAVEEDLSGEVRSPSNSTGFSPHAAGLEKCVRENEDGLISLDVLLDAAQNSQIKSTATAVGRKNEEMETRDVDPESGFETSDSAECLTANDHCSLPLSLSSVTPHQRTKKVTMDKTEPEIVSALESKVVKSTQSVHGKEPDKSTRTKRHASKSRQNKIKRSHSDDQLITKRRNSSSSDNLPLLEMNSHSSSVDSTYSADNAVYSHSDSEGSTEMCKFGSSHVHDKHYWKVAQEGTKESLA